jgi:hypothetical protein
MAKVPNIKDQLSKEYEAGVRAAAQLAGTYNAVTNHAYSLEDCILFKLGYLDKKKVRKVNTVTKYLITKKKGKKIREFTKYTYSIGIARQMAARRFKDYELVSVRRLRG